MLTLLLMLLLLGPPCIKRDANGAILRSWSVTHQFKVLTGYPNGRPGYVIDHVIPLCACGPDSVVNLAWERYDSSLVKDRTEVRVCRALALWAGPSVDSVPLDPLTNR